MSLKGNLSTMPFPDILQWINLGAKTGILKIVKDQDEFNLFFKNGSFLHSTSTRLKDHIFQLALREGQITEEFLRSNPPVSKDALVCGKTLIEKDILNKEQFLSLLKQNILNILFDVFTLDYGDFVFNEEKLDLSFYPEVSFTINDVIINGIKKLNRYRQSLSELGGLDSILKKQEGVISNLSLLDFNSNEAMLFELVDGKRSLNDIIKISKLPDYETVFILHDLFKKNVIEKNIAYKGNEISMQPYSEETLIQANRMINKQQYFNAIDLIEKYLQIFPADQQAIFLLKDAQRLLKKDINEKVPSTSLIPRLKISLDAPEVKSLNFSPQESYFLSRIDGKTPIKTISQICRVKLDEALRLIYRFFKAGIIDFGESQEDRSIKVTPQTVEYNQMLDSSPGISIPKVQKALGIKAMESGNYDLAEKHFYTSLEVEAEDAEIYYLLATALFHKDKLEEAENYVRKAISMVYDNSSFHILRGKILERKGDLEKALKSYNLALLWDPVNIQLKKLIEDIEKRIQIKKG